MAEFAQGGYVGYDKGGILPVGTCWTHIHPDECLISAADARAGRIRCSRADHPTPTSDCTKRADIDPTAAA